MSNSAFSTHQPPPWQVLGLVSHYLDPKTLSIAACVCKSWSITMSTDHIWKPICFTHYPSFSHLHLSHPTISYHRLFTIAYLSSKSRCRRPSPPIISLKDLIFSIDVFTNNSHVLTITESAEYLNHNGMFRFDMDVHGNEAEMVEINDEMMRVTWSVVLKEWRGVFFMMDCKGKGRFVAGGERWFSEELPSPGCCASSTVGTSGVVAELGIGLFSDGKKMKVEKVSMGLLSVISWRYLSIDDALRYLQHFLLAFNVY